MALFYFAPARNASTDSTPVILGRLKTGPAREGAHIEWAMDPVLTHLQPRLRAEQHALLAALFAALSNTKNLPALEQFPAWSDAQPEPID